jgi:hypothetical protein
MKDPSSGEVACIHLPACFISEASQRILVKFGVYIKSCKHEICFGSYLSSMKLGYMKLKLNFINFLKLDTSCKKILHEIRYVSCKDL